MIIRQESDRARPRPFETVRYIVAYSNAGNETATNVALVCCLPSNTLLRTDSAEQSNIPHAGNAVLSYWADGAWNDDTWDDTNASSVGKVRWLLGQAVAPGESGILVFKVIVK